MHNKDIQTLNGARNTLISDKHCVTIKDSSASGCHRLTRFASYVSVYIARFLKNFRHRVCVCTHRGIRFAYINGIQGTFPIYCVERKSSAIVRSFRTFFGALHRQIDSTMCLLLPARSLGRNPISSMTIHVAMYK